MNDFISNQPLTYLITAGETDPQNFSVKSTETLEIIKIAVEAKISLIQIREKKLPARLLFQLTTAAVKITNRTKTKLLVNDRADIALAADADGVHLTSSSIATAVIRQNFPDEFIIGVSAHSLVKAREAQIQGADFAVYSPIFYTPDKGKPKGLKDLHEVCKTLKSFPIIALGGINETNFAGTLDAGAKGTAGIRLFNDLKKNPELIERIQNYRSQND